MSDETQTPSEDAKRGRWRDDPLSVFLAAAAVLLGMMYFLEQRDVEVLEEASARALELGATTLDIDGCTVGSASTDGRTLVVSCSTSVEEVAVAAAAKNPDLAGFDAVIFAGSDGHLACSSDAQSWPNGCENRDTPSIGTP